MSTRLLRLLWIPPWMAAIYGCLQLHGMDLGFTHTVCGPWGCGPRMEALVGFHGFWTLLILPVALGIAIVAPQGLAKWLGWLTLVGSLAGLVAFVGWDLWQYTRGNAGTQYLLQRAGFAVVTNVDVPMCQLVLAGVGMIWIAGRRARVDGSASPEAATDLPPGLSAPSS